MWKDFFHTDFRVIRIMDRTMRQYSVYPWYTFLPGIRRPCAICSTSYASVYPFLRQEIGVSGRSVQDKDTKALIIFLTDCSNW